MKRIKLMILSFCVLAIVAGTLAFKAKGGIEFCYAEPNGSSPFCNKACPNHATVGKGSITRHLCIAATNGALLGDVCSGVQCDPTSVLSTTSEN